MNAIQEYVVSLRELVESQREVIERYHKLDENYERQIKLCEALIANYKEIICHLIEGRVSEETKSKMLKKFRG